MLRKVMSMWSKKLNAGHAPVYLIHGAESLLIHQATKWLKQSVLADAMEDFNFDRFDAGDSSFHVSKVVAAADSPPMMAARRLVWVQSFELLNMHAKDKVLDLIEYLKNPSPDTCLVLESHKKLDKKKALWKLLSKKGSPAQIVEFDTLKGKEVTQWLQMQAKRLKLKVNTEVQILIQESAEEQLAVILDHLQKLKLYISPRTDVHIDDVKALIPEALLQTTVWRLLDALSRKKTTEVLSMTHVLLQQGQSELSLFALIIKQIRELTLAYAVQARGGGEKELVQVAKLPPFVAKKLMGLLRNSSQIFKVNELMEAYQLLLHADRNLKGSKVTPTLVLENLLINLCLLGKN